MNSRNIRTYLKGLYEVFGSCGIKQLYTFIIDYALLTKQIENHIKPISDKHKVDNPGISFQKYLEIDFWLFENMRRCYLLGLHNLTKKLTILDLGTGAGYFPVVCRYYGHDVEALDVDDNEMYNEIVTKLGIPRYSQRISKYNDLVTNKKYDLITAFMICFNCHMQPDLWHIKEWEYFLNSILNRNLESGGEVFLSFNGESVEEPVSKELLEYFSAIGADVRGTEVHLK